MSVVFRFIYSVAKVGFIRFRKCNNSRKSKGFCYDIRFKVCSHIFPMPHHDHNRCICWISLLTLRSVFSVWRRAADPWRGRRVAASWLLPPTPPWSCPSAAACSVKEDTQTQCAGSGTLRSWCSYHNSRGKKKKHTNKGQTLILKDAGR